MFNFNKKLTTLAFLIIIATSFTLPAVARTQTPAQRLCGGASNCSVWVVGRNGVSVYSGPGYNYKRIRSIPRGEGVDVRVTKFANWVKLTNSPGWINCRNLERGHS